MDLLRLTTVPPTRKDLGSVRLRLGGFPVFPVWRSQNPANVALSVHASSEFSTKQSDPVEDHADPFQSALRDLHALVKYQFRPMFFLCQVLPSRSTPCGHVVNNLRTFLIFTSELRRQEPLGDL